MTIFTKDIQTEFLPSKPVKLPPPCVFCGATEHMTQPGVYVITHLYELHPGFTPRENSQVLHIESGGMRL